jgi:hypothetical protein
MTKPWDTVIDRESLKKSLEDRYVSDKTGGSFNAKVANTNNMLLGLVNGSPISTKLTIEAGFTTNMANKKQENFKEEVLKNDNSTLCKPKFNNTRYKP